MKKQIQDVGWVKVINLKVGDRIATIDLLGSGGFRPFNPWVSQNSNNQGKNSHSQTGNNISKLISNHNLDASFVSLQLANQQTKVNTNPDDTTIIFGMSTLEKIGAITNPAKNTWPALSNILANRNSSSSVNTGSLRNNQLIIHHSSIDKSALQWDKMNLFSFSQ